MDEPSAAAVVAGLGAGLVSTAPGGPVQPVVDGVERVCDQSGEESADLVEGQRDERRVGVAAAFAGGDDGQDGVGEHDEGDVPVPRVPAAYLGLVQADAFTGLEAGLHVPAGAGHPDQDPQWHRVGRPASVAGQFAVAAPAPDEEAVLPAGLAVRREDRDPGPVVVPVAFGPGSGGYPVPCPGG